MTKIWFQDFPTNNTLIKGYIDSDTLLGEASYYQKKCDVKINFNDISSTNENQLYSYHAYKFAKQALKRKNNII